MGVRKQSQLAGLVLGTSLLFGAHARADAMSCGTKLVSSGSTMYDVQARCGDPDAVAQRIEYRTVRAWVAGPCVSRQGSVQCGYAVERTVEVPVVEWTYDFGPHQFIRTLVFEQGTLQAIKTGSYGYKQR